VHSIVITDIEGRQVFKRITKETESTLYMNALGKGVYYISVYDESENYLGTQKAIIQ